MKNLLALIMALVFMLISAFPIYAMEEETSPDLGLEETVLVQPPEGEPEPEEPPILPDDSEDLGDEMPEDPEIPSDEDYAEGPGNEKPSDEGHLDMDSPDSVPDAEEEDEAERFINVIVPVSGQVSINPYGMKVDTRYGETWDQIIHEPQELVNFSDFPVLVSAQVMGMLQLWSEARFVFAPPADDTLDKEIFMYVEFQSEPTQWSYVYGDWPNQILVMDWWEGKEDVLTLDAFGIGYFRLFGAMTPFPASMWTEDDVMTVTLAFTFTPADERAEIPIETREESDESFDTIFNDSADAVFDAVQAVTPDPLPDIISGPVPGQNPELTSEEDLELELGTMDILDSFDSTTPVLNSEKEIKYPQ